MTPPSITLSLVSKFDEMEHASLAVCVSSEAVPSTGGPRYLGERERERESHRQGEGQAEGRTDNQTDRNSGRQGTEKQYTRRCCCWTLLPIAGRTSPVPTPHAVHISLETPRIRGHCGSSATVVRVTHTAVRRTLPRHARALDP